VGGIERRRDPSLDLVVSKGLTHLGSDDTLCHQRSVFSQTERSPLGRRMTPDTRTRHQRGIESATSARAEKAPPHPRGIAAVEKCLRLVEALAEHDEPTRLSDLARDLAIAPASAHQRLVTLVDAGWAKQLPDGRYRLTQRLASLGLAALDQVDLGAVLRTHMQELAWRTRESVDLAVLDGDRAVIVQKVDSSEPLRAQQPIGRHLPLAASAAGFVLLAFAAPRAIQQIILAGTELPDAARLRQIRESGFAIVTDGYLAGISAASAPIFDTDGHAIASLSLVVPTSRFNASEASAQVCATAAEVNQLLDDRRNSPKALPPTVSAPNTDHKPSVGTECRGSRTASKGGENNANDKSTPGLRTGADNAARLERND
jgi:DNA-binding IclR family transcriptional regulator